MLSKHELPVAREETERVDTLRYSWQKLQAQTTEVSSHLIEIQPGFKSELIDNVKVFITDCDDFYSDYRVVSITYSLTVLVKIFTCIGIMFNIFFFFFLNVNLFIMLHVQLYNMCCEIK